MDEKYYYHYDNETGDFKGFFVKSLHGDDVPTPNIEMTAEEHEYYIQNQNRLKFNLQTKDFDVIPEYVPSEVELAKMELSQLDVYLPRCVEDLIDNLGLDKSTLPQVMQDRLSRKTELRNIIREV